MPAPMETAYTALASALATALIAADFIADAAGLEIDPPSSFEPQTDLGGTPGVAEVQTFAALRKVRTGPVRTLVGTGSVRYVVERHAQIELGVYGGAEARRLALYAAAVTAAAGLQEASPTLSGQCERFALTEVEEDDLPPAGSQAFLSLFLRIRSSDPLGRTA